MKAKIWKQTLSAALAMLIVSGSVPVQPVEELFSSSVITANAEDIVFSMTVTNISELNIALSYGPNFKLGADLDCSVSDLMFYSPANTERVIDLNGHTLTVKSFGIHNSGTTLTIMDSVGGGKITSVRPWTLQVKAGQTLILESGTIENTQPHPEDDYYPSNYEAVDVYGGTFIMNGGTVRSNNYSVWRETSSAAVTVNGGTVTGAFRESSGKVSITGGKFSFYPDELIDYEKYGVYYDWNGSEYYYVYKQGDLIINSGVLEGTGRVYFYVGGKDSITAKPGDTVTVRTSPAENYYLSEIKAVENKENGSTITLTDNGSGAYSFTMPDEDVSVLVWFKTGGITYTEVPAKAPTCTENGNIKYYIGSDEKFYTLTDGVYTQISENDTVIQAKGHTPGEAELDNVHLGTCNKPGYYDLVVHCTECGEEISRETINEDPLDHIHGAPVVENVIPATCTEAGSYDEVVYCLVCSEEISRETVFTPLDPDNHTPGEAVREHEISPTCTEHGFHDEVVYCTECSEEISRETVNDDPLPHTPGNSEIENMVPATCKESGSYDLVVYCTECGKEISRETVYVEQLDHTPGNSEIENMVPATCQCGGSYDLVVYCTECGDEISRETVYVEQLDHTPGEAVREFEIPPSCIEDGSYDEVVYCTVCGEELSRETVPVYSQGHIPGDWEVENESPATCVVSGSYDLVIRCTECGEEIGRETVNDDPLGHTPGNSEIENMIPATYTEDGSYDLVTYCEICGEEISRETIDIPMLEKTEVIINSVDINGDITSTTVYAETYTDADYTVPSAPYLDGYNFKGWKVNGELCTTAEAVQTAVADLVAAKPETAIKVAVDYEKLETKYTVTVENGTLKNGKTSGRYLSSTQLYAVAKAKNSNGDKFSCWKVGDTIVGYETTYAFRMPSDNLTLTAVYVPETVEVKKAGTGYIESVKRTAENKLSFVSVLSIPDGCQMLKAGVVVQSTETLGGAELTKANAKLIKFDNISKKRYSSYKYTWTMTTSNYSKQWTVRPYLEYRDKNGKTQVVYGDAVSKCVNDVSM